LTFRLELMFVLTIYQATSGSRLEVVKPTDNTAGASDGEPPAIPTFDIMVPGLVSTAFNSLSSIH
jgi:hypothetical protein